MEDRTRSRKWLLTINNPEQHGYGHGYIRKTLEDWRGVSYWCMCDEVGGKEGTYHTHVFVMGANGILFSTVKKKFPKAHIDYCRGLAQENRDYVRKEGRHKGGAKEEGNLKDTFEESGDCPVERPGRRNDLADLYDMIKAGVDDYDIIDSDPSYISHLDKIERCRRVIREREFREKFRELRVEYWCGVTGSNKTRTVMERFGYANVYRVTNYRYPFDGYRGQDVIVFEEFNSSFSLPDMLTYLDGYPLELPCRYSNKVACYTRAYILSNVDLSCQYVSEQRVSPQSWDAFLRRIGAVRLFGRDGVRECGTAADYLYGFRSASDPDPFGGLFVQGKLPLSGDDRPPWWAEA